MNRIAAFFIRLMDLGVGIAGSIVCLLLMPVLGLLIRLDSKGPILYRAPRVGKGGRLFTMYKFRSMYVSEGPVGASVSPQGDPRVTDVGRWLRRTKLDELPQFFNLLKGDMTLIGPRPEAPDLAADYPEEAKKVFAAKPGILGPNQILGRNEEEWYPPGVDPRSYYLEVILPPKVANDLAYLEHKCFWGDLKLLAAGVWAILAGMVKRQHILDNRTQIYMLGLDTLCCLLALTGAFLIRFGRVTPDFGIVMAQAGQEALVSLLPVAVAARLPVFIYFGLYRTLIRHFSLADLRRVFDGVLIGSMVFLVVVFLLGLDIQNYGRSVCLLDWLLLTAMLMGYRVLAKIFYWRRRASQPESGRERRRAVIWGADEEGVWCHRFLQAEHDPSYDIIGFVDPDPRLRHRYVDGIKVLGDQNHLQVIKELYKVQEVYLAKNGDPQELAHLQRLCRQLSLRLLRFKPRAVEEIGL